jgi:hypothetical protein
MGLVCTPAAQPWLASTSSTTPNTRTLNPLILNNPVFNRLSLLLLFV